jgi:hypothetical protein
MIRANLAVWATDLRWRPSTALAAAMCGGLGLNLTGVAFLAIIRWQAVDPATVLTLATVAGLVAVHLLLSMLRPLPARSRSVVAVRAPSAVPGGAAPTSRIEGCRGVGAHNVRAGTR